MDAIRIDLFIPPPPPHPPPPPSSFTLGGMEHVVILIYTNTRLRPKSSYLL